MSPRESFDPAGPSISSVRPSEAPQSTTVQSPSAKTQAEKLHETLLLAQATSNLGRRKFISALLALHESKLHFQLGSPSPHFSPDTVARRRRSWSGKEESAIRPEPCFLHGEDRIVSSDAVQGATYGAVAGGW